MKRTYPIFELIRAGEPPSRRPRQVIFATLAKPDIRISSVLDGDLEVIEQAERADQVLVYDRVIGNDGLRWRDLLNWWQEKRGITDTSQGVRFFLRDLAAGQQGRGRFSEVGATSGAALAAGARR